MTKTALHDAPRLINAADAALIFVLVPNELANWPLVTPEPKWRERDGLWVAYPHRNAAGRAPLRVTYEGKRPRMPSIAHLEVLLRIGSLATRIQQPEIYKLAGAAGRREMDKVRGTAANEEEIKTEAGLPQHHHTDAQCGDPE